MAPRVLCSELSCDERLLVTDYDYINITQNARPPQLRGRRLATVNRQLADNTVINTGAHETQQFSSDHQYVYYHQIVYTERSPFEMSLTEGNMQEQSYYL